MYPTSYGAQMNTQNHTDRFKYRTGRSGCDRRAEHNNMVGTWAIYFMFYTGREDVVEVKANRYLSLALYRSQNHPKNINAYTRTPLHNIKPHMWQMLRTDMAL